VRITVVTKFVPAPADSGGKRRSLAVVRRLARIGDVTVCAFTPDDDRAGIDALRAEGVEVRAVRRRSGPVPALRGTRAVRSLTSGRFWDERLHEQVRVASDGADLLVVEYAQLAPYVEGTGAARTLLDLHNVESDLTASYAATRTGPLAWPYVAEAKALRALEARALERFDAVSVVSETDRSRLPGPVRGDLMVCPNGWDPGDPLPPSEEAAVAFVALMGWRPNADAARWLATDVWPRVLARRPEAKLLLIGREPTDDVQALAGPSVTVTGSVPEIAPWLGRAQVAVAPLRAGGGSRLKVLEALDAGRPLVATSIGIEGLEDLVGEGVVVADDADEFADAVLRLLDDPESARAEGLRGAAAVRARHSWEAALQPMADWVAGG
jgi:glycosyltransferase involved in cell wall biosynthesis